MSLCVLIGLFHDVFSAIFPRGFGFSIYMGGFVFFQRRAVGGHLTCLPCTRRENGPGSSSLADKMARLDEG